MAFSPFFSLGGKIALTISASKRDKGDEKPSYPFGAAIQLREKAAMNADFYAILLGLSKKEHEDMKILAWEDELLRQTVADCASDWRGYRAAGVAPLELRRTYLVRTALAAIQYGGQNSTNTLVAAAFALFLCDQIEQHVWELDRASGLSDYTKEFRRQ